jgi:prepilin-type N-terminal cleavage/methylation domain-containing protein
MMQNLSKKHTGFTLVELLVVIAIIGLLSTIVLVSFGPVRNQARDTAIKANMSQMRLAAEIKYINDATYVTTTTRSDFVAAKAAATAAGGTSYAENWAAGTYCFQFALPGGGSWCIDSTGYIGSANITCNGTVPTRCASV